MLRTFAILSFCLTSQLLSAQHGTLDPSFSNDGLVLASYGKYADGSDMVLQPDGKILVTGSVIDSVNRMAVFRFLPNGDLDATFADSGIAILPPQPYGSAGVAIALQKDGKIIAAGLNNISIPDDNLALVRFLPDGKLDPSFGDNGLSMTDIWGNREVPSDIVIQPDGKIVVAGMSNDTTFGTRLILLRFRPNGRLDTSFGDEGMVLPHYGKYAFAWASDVELLSDGKILVSGSHIGNPSFGEYIDNGILLRYLPDGSPDFSFGDNGMVLTDFGHEERLHSALIQPDGKIVVVGLAPDPSLFSVIETFWVARLHSDGSVDTGFGKNGEVITRFDDYYNYVAASNQAALQADGKIVVCGVVYIGFVDTIVNHNFGLLRLRSDGTPDATFGDKGRVLTNFGHAAADLAFSIVVQPDHKIVLAGYSGVGTSHSVALARYLSNYEPPPADTSVLEAFTRLYPNPTEGDATFEFWLGQETTVSLDLYDAQGRLLQNLWQPGKRAAGSVIESLSLGDFVAAGAYFLSLKRDGKRHYIPIVKI